MDFDISKLSPTQASPHAHAAAETVTGFGLLSLGILLRSKMTTRETPLGDMRNSKVGKVDVLSI